MSRASEIRPSFLEGMRGVAAWIVFLNHGLDTFLPSITSIEGAPPLAPALAAWVDSPLSCFWNGYFAVMLFFVHSGVVLSFRYFSSGKDAGSLPSAAARRYFRLAGPVVVTCLVSYVIAKVGGYGSAHELGNGIQNAWLAAQFDFEPSWLDALREGAYTSFIPGASTFGRSYNSCLWSIGIELCGSMLVFSYLALFGCLRRQFLFYLLAMGLSWGTYYFPFVLGVILCDVYVQSRVEGYAPLPTWLGAVLLVVGVYFGALPNGNIAPPLYFWADAARDLGWSRKEVGSLQAIGAAIFVLALLNTPAFQRWLDKKIFRRLGELSYSVYLIHLPILTSFGCRCFFLSVRTLGLSYSTAVVLSLFASAALTLAIALPFRRFIDEPCTRLARKWSDHYLLPPSLRERASAEKPPASLAA